MGWSVCSCAHVWRGQLAHGLVSVVCNNGTLTALFRSFTMEPRSRPCVGSLCPQHARRSHALLSGFQRKLKAGCVPRPCAGGTRAPQCMDWCAPAYNLGSARQRLRRFLRDAGKIARSLSRPCVGCASFSDSGVLSCHGLVSLHALLFPRSYVGRPFSSSDHACSLEASQCNHERVMKRKGVSQLVRVRYVVEEPTSSASTVRSSGAGAPPSEVDLRSVPEAISVQGVRIAARCDAPVVAPTTKGAKRKALEAAGSGQAKESALAAFAQRNACPECRRIKGLSVEGMAAVPLVVVRTWTGGRGRGCRFLPAHCVGGCAVKAMLKAGGYRSPAYYLSRAKEEHIVRGFAWDDQLALAVRKTTASITRGMGPGRQSSPLDLSGVWSCSLQSRLAMVSSR